MSILNELVYPLPNNLADDFSYGYFSGTNRLLGIGSSPGREEYAYDANGNMTKDNNNHNHSAKYDHRNLMTEIRSIKSEVGTGPWDPGLVDVLYITIFKYDEAGNRIRKTVEKYEGGDPDPVHENTGDNQGWHTVSDEFYVRDVSGKEIAIYSGSSLVQWNIWGLDNVGKINSDTTRNYYLKDHLGSIRAVLNSTNQVISAQDYDAWGYPLENRTYNSTAMRYDFTGKECDDQTTYDYFGARYYDSRVANWTSIDPLFEKHYDYSPYNYVLRSPNVLVDPNGLQVFVGFTGWGQTVNNGKAIDPSEYSSTSTTGSLQLAYDIQNLAIENKLEDFDMRFYTSSILGNEIGDAKQFIQDNLDTPGEKVYLYGYSMGGININDLANELQNEGIQVEALFTVDAYKPFTSSEQEISSNVEVNWNFYQTSTAPPFFSKGGRNYAESSNLTTVINTLEENSNHKNIDEKTNSVIFSAFAGKIIQNK